MCVCVCFRAGPPFPVVPRRFELIHGACELEIGDRVACMRCGRPNCRSAGRRDCVTFPVLFKDSDARMGEGEVEAGGGGGKTHYTVFLSSCRALRSALAAIAALRCGRAATGAAELLRQCRKSINPRFEVGARAEPRGGNAVPPIRARRSSASSSGAAASLPRISSALSTTTVSKNKYIYLKQTTCCSISVTLVQHLRR